MSSEYSVDDLDAMDDSALKEVDWKNSLCLNGRLLELHAEGQLGNEELAKLPRRPILCIDNITRIDEEVIEASFTFPEDQQQWAFARSESLEMLFQDQLDQLVGFWGSRKADGIGRALSSGVCKLQGSLDYVPGRTVLFRLGRRKWVVNKETGSGTAVFNGQILDTNDQVILDTKNVIVGILPPADILALRKQYGGTSGVDAPPASPEPGLVIPVYDPSTKSLEKSDDGITVNATQVINKDLWPLKYHFKGDPVVPGNFGTHGIIALLKDMARDEFGLKNPLFESLTSKKFSGMIFEDPKQIRFELVGVNQSEPDAVVAKTANLYLEASDGSRLIESPIYTYKNITVRDTQPAS